MWLDCLYSLYIVWYYSVRDLVNAVSSVVYYAWVCSMLLRRFKDASMCSSSMSLLTFMFALFVETATLVVEAACYSERIMLRFSDMALCISALILAYYCSVKEFFSIPYASIYC